MKSPRIVHNLLLDGWFVVRGVHQTPIGGRFDSKAQARAHLDRDRAHPFTAQESAAIEALVIESRGNGHDFGLVENVRWDGSRMALGALITSLRKKGVIAEIETVEVNGGPSRGGERYTQYVLADGWRAA